MARKSPAEKAAERHDAAIAEAQRLAGMLADAPAVDGGALAPPAFILDPRLAPALVVWRNLQETLSQSGRLAAADRDMFALLCYWRAEWIAAVDDIAANGYSFMARATAGGRRPWINPSVERRDTAAREMMALSARFGLTPLDRIALHRARAAGLLDDGDLFGSAGKGGVQAPAAGADAVAGAGKAGAGEGAAAEPVDPWADVLGPQAQRPN